MLKERGKRNPVEKRNVVMQYQYHIALFHPQNNQTASFLTNDVSICDQLNPINPIKSKQYFIKMIIESYCNQLMCKFANS